MTKLNRKGLGEFLVAGTLGLSLMAMGACGADEPGSDVTPGAEVGTAGTGEADVDIEDIVENPASFAGRTVTVTGEVEQIHSRRGAFSLTGGGIIAESRLMVLVRGDKAPTIAEDQQVRVTGRVRTYAVFDLEDFEQEVGWDFTPGLEDEVGKLKAVMIAETIVPIREQ